MAEKICEICENRISQKELKIEVFGEPIEICADCLSEAL